MTKKGYDIEKINVRLNNTAATPHVCVNMYVYRNIDVIIMRLFGPLFFLTVIPFVGFWLPVSQAMPRVATGFISFLSLQVFSKKALDMVPKVPNTLSWLDVCLFCLTEIMFLAVVQNVIAQVIHHKISRVLASVVDQLARTLFPVMSIMILALLFIMGNVGSEITDIMVVTQVILVVFVIVCVLLLLHIKRRLPHILMRHLVSELSDPGLLWRDGRELDDRELCVIFRFIDEDRSGAITAEEILKVFRDHGLRFKNERNSDLFCKNIQDACGTAGDRTSGRVNLDGFRKYFKDFFGGKLVRTMNAQQSAEST